MLYQKNGSNVTINESQNTNEENNCEECTRTTTTKNHQSINLAPRY